MAACCGVGGPAEDDCFLVTGPEDDQTRRLRSVQRKVAAIESALVTGDLKAGAAAAHELVALTTGLLEGLELAAGDSDRDAKLIATLRVYRNAAFVYRRVAGVSGTPDPALAVVCEAMIEHGHELRALFDQGSDPGRSIK